MFTTYQSKLLSYDHHQLLSMTDTHEFLIGGGLARNRNLKTVTVDFGYVVNNTVAEILSTITSPRLCTVIFTSIGQEILAKLEIGDNASHLAAIFMQQNLSIGRPTVMLRIVEPSYSSLVSVLYRRLFHLLDAQARLEIHQTSFVREKTPLQWMRDRRQTEYSPFHAFESDILSF